MASQVEISLRPSADGNYVTVDEPSRRTSIEGFLEVQVKGKASFQTQWIHLELRKVVTLTGKQRVHQAAGGPLAEWKADPSDLGRLSTGNFPFSIAVPDSASASKKFKYQLMAALCFKEGKTWLKAGKCVVKTTFVPVTFEHRSHRPPAIVVTVAEVIPAPKSPSASTGSGPSLSGSSSDEEKVADGNYVSAELSNDYHESHLPDVENEGSRTSSASVRPPGIDTPVHSLTSSPVASSFLSVPGTITSMEVVPTIAPKLVEAVPVARAPELVVAVERLRSLVETPAFADPEAFILRSSDGSIEGGTLEGLVVALIDDSTERRKLIDYRDSFLKASSAFGLSDHVHKILVRLFKETDNNPSAEIRTNLRFNIVTLLKYWVTMDCARFESETLLAMKAWSLSVNSSAKMTELAAGVASAIYARPPVKTVCVREVSAQTWDSPLISEATPWELAKGMSKLEGDGLVPADYLEQVTRGHSVRVQVALDVHKKLERWVIQSILQHDRLETRVQVANFMIDVCEECRLLRNFNSMAAVANALTSEAVKALRVTKEKLDMANNETLMNIVALLDPADDHHAYKSTLNGSSESCIPWMAAHLQELQAVFDELVFQHDDCSLIKFAAYARFGTLMEALYGCTPCVPSATHSAPLSYLANQLKGLPEDTEQLDEYYRLRSLAVQAVGTDAGEELERASEASLKAFSSERERVWLRSAVQVAAFKLSKTVGSHW